MPEVFSCEFCKIFKSTFFAGHLSATASVNPGPSKRSLVNIISYLQIRDPLVIQRFAMKQKNVVFLELVTVSKQTFRKGYFMAHTEAVVW